MGKIVDLIGQKFGKLTVLGRGKDYISPKGSKSPRWKVKCEECEIEYEISEAVFLKRKNQNCNRHDHAYENLVKQKFGKLTVIKKDEEYYIAPKSKKKSIKWICKCDCGNTISVIGTILKAKGSTQCKKCKCKSMRLNGHISAFRLYSMKQTAKKRNIYFDPKIDKEYLWNLFLKQNKKCALSNIPIHFAETKNLELYHKGTTSSLDRIDSSKGYIKSNIQWVHKDINKIKCSLNQKEFIQICKKIWRNNNEKN
ncbi:MAG TPA: hypothetical protein VMZ91_08265 [Candidatus Paceibacterota bacterium]|nr:hypothetical protein [Candidatus Paceibacterota bacterium]